jgi:uncharacterized protein YejL (UPF0352 family)
MGVAERTSAQSGDARAVAAQFEALLANFALAPVARSLGFYGDIVTGAVARAVAAESNDGLAASFADDLFDRPGPPK